MTRAYRVEGGGEIRFATTNATARDAKNAIQEEMRLGRNDVAIAEVEIPYGKAELIDWINGLVKELAGSAGSRPVQGLLSQTLVGHSDDLVQRVEALEAKVFGGTAVSDPPFETETETETPPPATKPKGAAVSSAAAKAAERRAAKGKK